MSFLRDLKWVALRSLATAFLAHFLISLCFFHLYDETQGCALSDLEEFYEWMEPIYLRLYISIWFLTTLGLVGWRCFSIPSQFRRNKSLSQRQHQAQHQAPTEMCDSTRSEKTEYHPRLPLDGHQSDGRPNCPRYSVWDNDEIFHWREEKDNEINSINEDLKRERLAKEVSMHKDLDIAQGSLRRRTPGQGRLFSSRIPAKAPRLSLPALDQSSAEKGFNSLRQGPSNEEQVASDKRQASSDESQIPSIEKQALPYIECPREPPDNQQTSGSTLCPTQDKSRASKEPDKGPRSPSPPQLEQQSTASSQETNRGPSEPPSPSIEDSYGSILGCLERFGFGNSFESLELEKCHRPVEAEPAEEESVEPRLARTEPVESRSAGSPRANTPEPLVQELAAGSSQQSTQGSPDDGNDEEFVKKELQDELESWGDELPQSYQKSMIFVSLKDKQPPDLTRQQLDLEKTCFHLSMVGKLTPFKVFCSADYQPYNRLVCWAMFNQHYLLNQRWPPGYTPRFSEEILADQTEVDDGSQTNITYS